MGLSEVEAVAGARMARAIRVAQARARVRALSQAGTPARARLAAARAELAALCAR
jgi:hypothetical protein